MGLGIIGGIALGIIQTENKIGPIGITKTAASVQQFYDGLLDANGDSAQTYLERMVREGIKADISRGFQEVLYRRWGMSQVRPALKGFLTDSNPFIRFCAANALYSIGDNSGYSTLLELVRSPNAMDGIGEDIRFEAATVLSRFRQYDATQALFDLYQKTNDGNVFLALETLAPEKLGQMVPPKHFHSDASAIRDYGLLNAQQFLPQILSTLATTTDQEKKMAAAWAVAVMTNNPEARKSLFLAAKPALTGQQVPYNTSTALKYLGVIHTPESKKVLEDALRSPNSGNVEVAVVNLLYNQGGSEKAIQALADQLEERTPSNRWMNWDLVLSLASQFQNDPVIHVAAEVFDQTSRDDSWKLYSIERRDWPIYNWIDNYVVTLKR